MSNKMRQLVEKKIVRRMVSDLLRAGFVLNVDNGGEDMELPAPTGLKKVIMDTMMQTDDDRLYVYSLTQGEMKQPSYVGWVQFIYGNDGYDVISDYTVNLESHMAGVNKLAEFYGG